MSIRQSHSTSGAFVVVIGGVTALIVGAIVLTFVVFPLTDVFMASELWTAQTPAGSELLTYMGGFWVFWPAIILIAILSFIWINTRQ